VLGRRSSPYNRRRPHMLNGRYIDVRAGESVIGAGNDRSIGRHGRRRLISFGGISETRETAQQHCGTRQDPGLITHRKTLPIRAALSCHTQTFCYKSR
jgi:hypothetical protein